MKKIFYGLMAAMVVVCMVSCSGEIDADSKARLKADVQSAIKEVVKMEAVNADDTLIVLNGSDTTVSIADVKTDSLAADSTQSSRPIIVEVYYDDSALDGEYITGIVAIVGVFGGGVMVFFFLFSFWFKAKRDRNRVIETAIRNNAKIDPIVFNDFKSPRTRLHAALVWMAWGLGIAVFFLFVDAVEVIGLGAVPFFVGVAKLITYFLEDRKQPVEEKINEPNIDAE